MPNEVFSIMTHNIEGGKHPDMVIATAIDANVDILAVQETGPDEHMKVLKKAKLDLEMPHSRVARAPAYDLHVATLSKFPIRRTRRLLGFRNAAMVTTIDVPNMGLVAVCNNHSTPFLEQDRLLELETALTALDGSGTPFKMIVADLNSLSPQDDYPPELQDRFNEAQRRKFMVDGKVQHRVIGRLLEEGYVDAAVQCGKNDESTVPTPSNRDTAHAVPLRLDYVMVSEALAPHIRDYKVIKNHVTDAASDHYPVVVVFDRAVGGL